MRTFNPFYSKLSVLLFIGLFFLSACSSYKEQMRENLNGTDSGDKPAHTFYIIGGSGNGSSSVEINQLLSDHLGKASKNSSLLYTGDYTQPASSGSDLDKSELQQLLTVSRDFKGKTYFIPGDNEWASDKTKDIEWVENYLKDQKIKRTSVAPNNVCPLEFIELSETVDMLLVDSQWYITNWDRVEDMNRKCPDMATRRRFVSELEGYIKDARFKNLVIVMHHPIYSNGTYRYGLGGFSQKDANFDRYNDLRIQISTLAQEIDRVTIVSGHEESLQYLIGGNIHQIISGSMGGVKPTKLSDGAISTAGGKIEFEGVYSNGQEGFAVLKYYKDGSSQVEFISSKKTIPTFKVTAAFKPSASEITMPIGLDAETKVAITTNESKLNKSGFYNFIWGKRYRSYFGVPVTAEVGMLNSIYSGLEVLQPGGGHQSFSARLEGTGKKQYAMRGLEKNALKFLRFKVKGVAYTEEEYNGTFAEEAIYDFFSTTHPYMQLVINPLAKSARVNHANTSLFYLPKQPGFEILGDEYGNQLYFIEERPSDGHLAYEGYNRSNPIEAGKIINFESTTDVLEKIKEDEKYSVDQRAFIRARIFDMLIGDWDRHEDQWRWAEYEVSKNDIRFLPIPRDRDAAFSKFDGIAIPLIKLILPDVRFWQSYGSEIPDVKWFNGEGNNLDRAFVNQLDVNAWKEEALKIQKGMTQEVIDEAFLRLPSEIQDAEANTIKEHLKGRLNNIVSIAERYGKRMDATVAIHGTQKDDKIEVTRNIDGTTHIMVKRKLSNKENKIYFDRTFDPEQTNEIWVYGLDDKDTFIVNGEGPGKIKVRLIGGYGKDTFNITNTKNLKVYEWKYENTEFEDKKPATQFTNKYETNTYHWRYFKENNNILLPTIGFRRDDGLYLGASNTYTNYGFNGNPFRYQHQLAVNYFFDFQAIELDYNGTFANIIPNWNLELDAYFTNNSYAKNFFGFGNDTQHDPDVTDIEFNRARTEQIKVSAGISNEYIKFKALFENFEVQRDSLRFFSAPNVPNQVFQSQQYAGAEIITWYTNQDATDFPTKALHLSGTIGYKSNLELENNNFAYASAAIGIQQKLIASGNLVFATLLEAKTNFGDDYFFYHAPSIGGNNGLRGYRDERFTGQTYFYQSSDLKLRLGRVVTGVVPITYGAYGGFDYGRVWVENDTSSTWHTSYGGGLWLSGLNSFGLNLGYFISEEDAIFQVGFGFGF